MKTKNIACTVALLLCSKFATAQIVKIEEISLKSGYLKEAGCSLDRQKDAIFTNGIVHGLGLDCLLPGINVITNNGILRTSRSPGWKDGGKKTSIHQLTAFSNSPKALKEYFTKLQIAGFVKVDDLDDMIRMVDSNTIAPDKDDNPYFASYRFYSPTYFPADGLGGNYARGGVFYINVDRPCMYEIGKVCSEVKNQ